MNRISALFLIFFLTVSISGKHKPREINESNATLVFIITNTTNNY